MATGAAIVQPLRSASQAMPRLTKSAFCSMLGFSHVSHKAFRTTDGVVDHHVRKSEEIKSYA